MKTKTCPNCKEVKDETHFWKNLKTKSGLCSYCKICQSEIRREKRKKKIGYWATENQNRKKTILKHYGKACARCGDSDWRALTMDHINGDGAEHRKVVPSGRLYGWLIKNKFPPGFQTLCMNCQFIKRHENKEWNKNKTISK